MSGAVGFTRTGTVNQPSQMETSCGSLLSELQTIWDEIGEPDDERDKMLFELEQECLDAYRRKVDQARRCQVQLRQSLADCEAQLADICGALGDLPVHIKKDQNAESGITSGFSTTPLATPTKNVFSFNENITPPKMQIPVPATPPTVSTTMQIATTPFTPGIRDTEEVEYSFEERRAGFIIPKSTMLTHF